MKNKLFKLANWAEVIRRRPTLESKTAPVAETYWLYASVAIKIRVVPVSTIPAVVGRIVVLPYLMDWSMPQELEAGAVVVLGV